MAAKKLTLKSLAKQLAALEQSKRPNITVDGDCGIMAQRLKVLENLSQMGREMAAALRATAGPVVHLNGPLTCNNLTVGAATVHAAEGATTTLKRGACWDGDHWI